MDGWLCGIAAAILFIFNITVLSTWTSVYLNPLTELAVAHLEGLSFAACFHVDCALFDARALRNVEFAGTVAFKRAGIERRAVIGALADAIEEFGSITPFIIIQDAVAAFGCAGFGAAACIDLTICTFEGTRSVSRAVIAAFVGSAKECVGITFFTNLIEFAVTTGCFLFLDACGCNDLAVCGTGYNAGCEVAPFCTAVFILDELRSVAVFAAVELAVTAGIGALEDACARIDLAARRAFEIAGLIAGAVGRASLDIVCKNCLIAVFAVFEFAVTAGGGWELDASGFVHLAVIGACDGTRNIGRWAPFDTGGCQDIVAIAVFCIRVGHAVTAVGTWRSFTTVGIDFTIGCACK